MVAVYQRSSVVSAVEFELVGDNDDIFNSMEEIVEFLSNRNYVTRFTMDRFPLGPLTILEYKHRSNAGADLDGWTGVAYGDWIVELPNQAGVFVVPADEFNKKYFVA